MLSAWTVVYVCHVNKFTHISPLRALPYHNMCNVQMDTVWDSSAPETKPSLASVVASLRSRAVSPSCSFESAILVAENLVGYFTFLLRLQVLHIFDLSRKLKKMPICYFKIALVELALLCVNSLNWSGVSALTNLICSLHELHKRTHKWEVLAVHLPVCFISESSERVSTKFSVSSEIINFGLNTPVKHFKWSFF
jgi:hypothetical protein